VTAPKGEWGRSALNTVALLAAGAGGGLLFTVLNVPAGALLGSICGAMAVNGALDAVARRRSPSGQERTRIRLSRWVRVVGQVLLGVLAGTRLEEPTLRVLWGSLGPVIAAVVVLIGSSILVARYLFLRHGVDGVTAIMSTAPGGASELSAVAEEKGAKMHVVFAVHMFRVLVVLMVAMPVILLIMRTV